MKMANSETSCFAMDDNVCLKMIFKSIFNYYHAKGHVEVRWNVDYLTFFA